MVTNNSFAYGVHMNIKTQVYGQLEYLSNLPSTNILVNGSERLCVDYDSLSSLHTRRIIIGPFLNANPMVFRKKDPTVWQAWCKQDTLSS